MFRFNISENNPQVSEREKDLEKMTEEFGLLVNKNKYSADDIREAYYRFCGVSDNKGNRGIEEIVSKMKEMTDNGYPLNRLARIIEAKQVFEDAVPNYYKFVDSMDISGKENKILRSIIDDMRSGEISCIVQGKVLATFKIDIARGGSKEVLSIALSEQIKDVLGKIPKGQKYEFSFTEK